MSLCNVIATSDFAVLEYNYAKLMNIKISIHQVYTHIVQYPGISVSLLAGQLGVSTRTINRHIQMLMSQ